MPSERGWVCGYLLPVGAIVCLNCAASLPSSLLEEPMRTTDPEIEIDNADCDNCGEKVLPE